MPAQSTTDVETIEGVVVDPDLVFTTPKRERAVETVEERSMPFQIDDQIYTLIRPSKLPEVVAGLIEAGARRATEADALYAGTTFLRKVIAPESLARLQARLDDDADDFGIADLFDYMEKIAVKLIRSSPGAAPATGPRPARRRPAR